MFGLCNYMFSKKCCAERLHKIYISTSLKKTVISDGELIAMQVLAFEDRAYILLFCMEFILGWHLQM